MHDRFINYIQNAFVNFHGIMLDPATMGVDLCKLPLTDGDDVLIFIEQNRAAAACALINRQNITCHFKTSVCKILRLCIAFFPRIVYNIFKHQIVEIMSVTI